MLEAAIGDQGIHFADHLLYANIFRRVNTKFKGSMRFCIVNGMIWSRP